jgi:hypothetical protein
MPRFIPHTSPTPPDQSNPTGRKNQQLPNDSNVTGPVRPIASTSYSLGRGFDPHRPYFGFYTKVDEIPRNDSCREFYRELNPGILVHPNTDRRALDP